MDYFGRFSKEVYLGFNRLYLIPIARNNFTNSVRFLSASLRLHSTQRAGRWGLAPGFGFR
ncbi:MAG: hypothetical protein FJZ64_03105 [Chlamydiae bacterium]|nr:hypothetical protein [Chlamydiota bacterium]